MASGLTSEMFSDTDNHLIDDSLDGPSQEALEEEREREEINNLIDRAYRLAEKAGLLYTQKYLKIASLAVEIEAGEPYYLREADEVADGPCKSG